MTRADHAEKMFRDGYNCAQSVVGSFLDKIDLNEELALKIASPFGGGMGRLREVCGAVSGMWIVLGNVEGYFDKDDRKKKAEVYKTVQTLAKKFEAITGSIVCRNLLNSKDAKDTSPIPSERTEDYYKKRSCVDLVRLATNILEDYLNEQELK